MSGRGMAQAPRHRGPCPECGQDTALNEDGTPITNHLRARTHVAVMAARGAPADTKRHVLPKAQARFLASLAAGGPVECEGRDAKMAKALRARGLAKHIGQCLTAITEAGREWLAGEKA